MRHHHHHFGFVDAVIVGYIADALQRGRKAVGIVTLPAAA